jgi:hypothetical protein
VRKKEGFIMRGYWIAILVGVGLVHSATAQTAVRFAWKKDTVLTYRVDQTTSASDVVEGKTTETGSKMTTVKRWQILAVDGAGVATVQLSVASLHFEVKTPKGETLMFDSTQPEKSDPQLREQMEKFVGRPLAVLRVDTLGRVVEVKESKQAPASRFESEVPFVVLLPAAEDRPGRTVQPGSAWERSYQVTLEPPQGTGDKFEAVQKYTCQKIDGPAVTISLTTAIKNLPASQVDQVPLLEMQPEGEVVFDAANGRLHSAHLRIDKELKGLQGEGSSYHFQSTYTEQLVKE